MLRAGLSLTTFHAQTKRTAAGGSLLDHLILNEKLSVLDWKLSSSQTGYLESHIQT